MLSKIKETMLKICGISLLMFPLSGQAQTDTTTYEMQTVVVAARKTATTTVGLGADGTMRLNARLFDILPKIMGNADPVHYAQMLPGVQTTSELDAGLHIQGSDNTHNLLSIQGVPVYNAAHLLGIFSVFNASHYAAMTLKKNPNEAADASRLGGTLCMELPDEITDSVHGEAAVGLISSQGTLRFPTGRRSALILSARGSYLNLLYSRWLTMDDMRLRYGFYDLNGTWLWKPNDNHRIWIDTYWGQDRIYMEQDEYQASIRLGWGNRTAALHWHYSPNNATTLKNTLYYTHYNNNFHISQAEIKFHLPSDISDVGWRSDVGYKNIHGGAEAIYHNLLPQNPKTENLYNQILSPQSRQHTQEYTLFANYTHTLLPGLNTTMGLRATAYVDYIRKAHLAADPSIRFVYTRGNWQLAADYALRHQYLFQTGTSSWGMPTEFWASIGDMTPPQWGHNTMLSTSLYLGEGRYRLSAEVYYKYLYNQIEYDGDMMKFLNADYRLEDNLLHGRGYNYGFSVMVGKQTGRLNGWISYAFGRARRQFMEDGYAQTYSASHERPHEVDAVLSYRLNAHWTLAATYVFASGTPFTAPKNFYIMNGMLIAEYGKHNARRLRPYNRLDISVNYLLPSRHLKESGFNLSLYNATGQHNDITCRLKVHNGHYLYSHFALIKFILPSVSYFLKF